MMKHLATLLCLLFAFATSAHAQRFLPDDPILSDDDRIPIPQPARVELSQLYDFVENTFGDPAAKTAQRARNINTLGQTPDSSWFTNRIGTRLMTTTEILHGANSTEGPDTSGKWTIVSAKSEGISPGFRIKDSRGDTYFVKFDPKKYPQLATSSEIITSKFFHAFGYNVPEYYLVFITRDQLQIDPEATISEKGDTKRPMTERDVDDLLDRVGRLKDGRIPVSASLRLQGEDIGKFKYYGTRSDDANDIFPHEDRRELRGLRVFSAWLNHDDSRSINTLNMYVPKGDAGYVKHYLIDFGSTLGSGSVTIQSHRAGNEYIIEKGPILKSGLTFGIWDRPWRYYDYPPYPEIGRLESAHFEPEKWRPEYPNPAFEKMQNEDALWATEILMKITDDIIRAVVANGKIQNPQAEQYLGDTLIERKNRILRYYLARLNPLSGFTATGNTVKFTNLGLQAGIASGASYQYQWFHFNNNQNTTEPAGSILSASAPSIEVPQDDSPYLMLRIQTVSPAQPNWKKKVDVYIRNGNNKEIVGIEREN